MFKDLSLKAKMLLAFLSIASLLLIVGVIGWVSLGDVSEKYEHIAHFNLGNTQTVGRMRYRAQDINRTLLRVALSTTEQQKEAFRKDFAEGMAKYKEFEKKYLEIPFGENEEPIYNQMNEKAKLYFEKSTKAIQLSTSHTQADKDTFDKMIHDDLPLIRAEFDEKISRLLDYHDEQSKIWKKKAQDASQFSKVLSSIIVLAGVLMALLVGFMFSNSLAKVLRAITQQIAEAANQTAAASNQLSSASQQLSSGSTEAAASLEETVSSLEELSSMVKLNADHAKEASTLSQQGRDGAETGEREIQQLITAMSEVAQGSKKIEEIINVIDDIAFQTNLLALNAAVEAARAGEQGKGFAVVAEAVRNLAQRSAAAAKDITVLIKDSVHKSESGSKVADRSGVVLKNIVTSVKKVADLNNEISSASQEQANGIGQISKAMNQLDQATQTNASSAEEVAASSEEMSSQAVSLQTLVKELTGVVEGNGIHKKASSQDSSAKQQGPRVSTQKQSSRSTHLASMPPHQPEMKREVVAKNDKREPAKVIPFENSTDYDSGITPGKVGTTDGF